CWTDAMRHCFCKEREPSAYRGLVTLEGLGTATASDCVPVAVPVDGVTLEGVRRRPGGGVLQLSLPDPADRPNFYRLHVGARTEAAPHSAPSRKLAVSPVDVTTARRAAMSRLHDHLSRGTCRRPQRDAGGRA